VAVAVDARAVAVVDVVPAAVVVVAADAASPAGSVKPL